MVRPTRIPYNIIQLNKFDAIENEKIEIEITNLLFLMPIFRWQGDHWVDCVGEYDLCMNEDGSRYYFHSRIPGANTFGYRFLSIGHLEKRFSKN